MNSAGSANTCLLGVIYPTHCRRVRAVDAAKTFLTAKSSMSFQSVFALYIKGLSAGFAVLYFTRPSTFLRAKLPLCRAAGFDVKLFATSTTDENRTFALYWARDKAADVSVLPSMTVRTKHDDVRPLQDQGWINRPWNLVVPLKLFFVSTNLAMADFFDGAANQSTFGRGSSFFPHLEGLS